MDNGMGAAADVTVAGGVRVCPRCGKPVRRGPRAKWCSESCRVAAWWERRCAGQVTPGRTDRAAGIQISSPAAESPGVPVLRVIPPALDVRPAAKPEAPGTPRGDDGVVVLPRDGVVGVRR